jgi:hypothetical protein
MDHVERRGEAWALEFAGWPAREGDELRLAMSLHVEPAILCRLERLADAYLRTRARRSPLASSASIDCGVLHLPDQNLISGCRPPQSELHVLLSSHLHTSIRLAALLL